MDLRNVQTFIRAAELGSFTKAAKELGYVQSAVTMQIQQLEKELGFPLFDRIGKRVSLTTLGAGFLEHAYGIAKAVLEATNFGKSPADIKGTLRLGLLESLLFGNMLQLLPRFRNAYQNVALQLKMGQAADLLQELKQNRLDMVYLSSDLHADPDLCCHYKRREQLVFVCSPEHPAAQQEKIPAKALFDYDFIVTERMGICYRRLQELSREHHAMLHDAMEVDSTVAIAALIQENKALAFLPEYSVQKQLAAKQLTRINVDIPPQIYYSQILCHKSRWVSPFMAGLIEEIRAAFPDRE